jgi:hypothetical protein
MILSKILFVKENSSPNCEATSQNLLLIFSLIKTDVQFKKVAQGRLCLDLMIIDVCFESGNHLGRWLLQRTATFSALKDFPNASHLLGR